jgi:hypothetical protein
MAEPTAVVVAESALLNVPRLTDGTAGLNDLPLHAS